MADAVVVTVESLPDGKLVQRVEARSHIFEADEPESIGDDRGPTPYELLLATLGACTSMTVRMYADMKEIPLQGIAVRLTYNRDHVTDCEDGEEETRRVHKIGRELRFGGDLTDEQRERLLQIAERCPVHRTLVEEKEITTTLIG
jgi:putative redox protein